MVSRTRSRAGTVVRPIAAGASRERRVRRRSSGTRRVGRERIAHQRGRGGKDLRRAGLLRKPRALSRPAGTLSQGEKEVQKPSNQGRRASRVTSPPLGERPGERVPVPPPEPPPASPRSQTADST